MSDLLDWRPPCRIIVFPADKRRGHAFKVAYQLSKARTNKEADWILTRALVSYREKLIDAGVSAKVAARHMETFERLIAARCDSIGSKWMPVIESLPENGGAA